MTDPTKDLILDKITSAQIEVVWCKDCKWFGDQDGLCYRYADETNGIPHSTQEYFYCAVAEKERRMSNKEAIENVRTIQKGYLKLIEQKVDEGTFLTDDFNGTWKANTPLTEIYKRNAESLEVAITALEENQKLKAMVDELADCLDGCPLRDPCNDLPREWCMGHCGYKQQEASKECWIKWAEVMADEKLD